MPAETHRLREAVDMGEVLDLIGALLDVQLGVDGIDVDAQLADLGVDDLATLHLWDAAVEELAERGAAEPDVDELLLARTVGDLAALVVQAFGSGSPRG